MFLSMPATGLLDIIELTLLKKSSKGFESNMKFPCFTKISISLAFFVSQAKQNHRNHAISQSLNGYAS
jgi:hypothetical protein